jgi:MFS family permease
MTEPTTVTPPSSINDSPGTGKMSETPARGGWLAFAAVLWLIAVLTIVRNFLAPTSGDIALAAAATSLLQLTLAGILAGAAVGIWVSGQVAARTSRVPRQVVTVAAGLITGALASASVLLVRGMPANAVWVLALILGFAGAVGGALSMIQPQIIVTAAVVATLVNVFLFNVMQVNSDWLLPIFGANGTAAADQAASGYLSAVQALVAGLIGGYVAYRVVRREARLAGVTPRWPLYLLAGGLPGLLWIVGDLVTRIGTARLLTLVSSDAAGDRLVQEGLGASRLNTGLVLFFIGAITAMVAFGRKLPRKTD